MAAATSGKIRLIDVAVNLTDSMFSGEYNGKKYHDSDLSAVLQRGREAGVARMVGVSGSLAESQAALDIVRTQDGMFATVGVHPTRCQEFEAEGADPVAHYDKLLALAVEGKSTGKVVAIGETGLDYDRLQFCPKEVQIRYFERQFELAKAAGLPMLFHNRNTGGDFERMVAAHRSDFTTGVVHSFTGTTEEMQALVALDLYIGINGCSLKTEELCAMVAAIPLDRIILETDAPWCEIRPTHAGFKHIISKWPAVDKKKFAPGSLVKNRYEPCHVRQVLEVVAGVRGAEVEAVAEAVWTNSIKALWPSE